jgi:hypothetical protein
VAFGVAAAGAGLGAMFGLVAVSDKTSLDRDCVSKACPESSQSLIDDSRRAATLATVGFTVAVVGLGAGLAYLLWPAGRPHSGSSPAVSAPVVVRFGPGVLVGTF